MRTTSGYVRFISFMQIFFCFLFFPNSVHALMVGVHSQELRIPIGSPTGGYAQALGKDEPGSPYAIKFPATRGIHTPLRIKVIYFLDRKSSLTLVGMDSIGVDLNIYKAVRERLPMLTAQDDVILGGTHTHAGPGRLARNGFFWVAMDTYSEWLFQEIVKQVLDAIAAAQKNLFDAHIGFGTLDATDVINDRRCENPEAKDGTLRFIKISDSKNKVKAVVLNLGIHGTILDYDSHYFSGDAPGLIELKVEEQFKQPVLAMLMQGTGGDISPRDPGSHQITWDKMESIGQFAAEKLVAALPSVKNESAPELSVLNLPLPLDRDALGYKDKEFPHPFGGFLCGMGQQGCDEDFQTPQEWMNKCPFSDKKYALTETIVSGVKLGEWVLLTLPGEPVTPLGYDLRNRIKKELKTENVMILGYSQDHLGYLLSSWDWWQGGYESSMNPWGWKLGEYLIDKSFLVAKSLIERSALPKISVTQPLSYTKKPPVLPVPELAQNPGKVDKEAAVKEGDVAFSWFGGDSYTDRPDVGVERNEKGKWLSVLTKNKKPLTNSHYSTFLNFSPVPTYKKDPKAVSRAFQWEIVWRTKRPVPSTLKLAPGTYRFHVKGKAFDGKEAKPYELMSGEFEL